MSATRTLIVISALFLNITVFFVLKNIFDFRVSLQEEEKLRKLGATIFENARPIRPFTLRTSSNQAFTKNSLQKPLNLFFFGFTECPDICPLTLREYSDAVSTEEFATIADSVDFYFVSVDPERDSLEVIASYVDSYSADIFGLTDLEELKYRADGGFNLGVSTLASELFVSYSDTASLIAGQHKNKEHSHSKFPAEPSRLITHSGHISILNRNGEHMGVLRSPHRSEDLIDALSLISDSHM